MTSVIWMNVKMEGIKENMYIVSSKSEVIGPRGRFKPRKTGHITLITTNGGTRNMAVYAISCTMFHGEKPYPSYTVDHIDIDRKNNDISNLRWASKSLQAKNKKKTYRQGKRVVYKNKSGKIKKTYKSVAEAVRVHKIRNTSDTISKKLKKGSIKVKGGFLEYNKLVPSKNSIIKSVPKWIHPNVKSNWIVSSWGLVKNNCGWTNGARSGVYYSSKGVRVHRMVAAAFHGRPDNPLRKDVNHKDGKGFNNNINNLEWVTPSENSIHAVETGLSKSQRPIVKYSLDGTRLGSFKSITSIDGNISRALNNKGSWALGFQWRYADENPPDRIESILKPVVKKLPAISRARRSRSIVKYALDGTKIEEFGDATKASESVDHNGPTSIRKACRRHCVSSGFQWRYKKDAPDKLKPFVSSSMSIVKYALDGTKIEEFGDAHEAVINSPGGDDPARIRHACRRHCVSSGFQWRYKKDAPDKLGAHRGA